MANRLALVLNERKVQQDILAKAIHLTPATISRWCNNISQPSPDKLYLMAKYLQVDMNDLIYTVSKTVMVDKTIHLDTLGTNDAFLAMVMGSSNLVKLQIGMLVIRADFPDGRMKSYPITLLGYTNLYRPVHIPLIEVGVTIENCKYTTITVENCPEILRLTFYCPSSSNHTNNNLTS